MCYRSIAFAPAVLAFLLSASSVQAWGGLQTRYMATGPGTVAQADRNAAQAVDPPGAWAGFGQPYNPPNSQASMMRLWKHDVNRIYGGYTYGGPHTGGLGDYLTSPFGYNLYGGTGVWRPY
jgi:hypothetical protein